MKKTPFIIASLLTGLASLAQSDKTLLFISDTHLDTQWNWDVNTTINEYIKNTLEQNLALLDKYPNFQLNFEAAIHYKWMREYYPRQYARLKNYISARRWNVAGGCVNANDVMISSAESIMRNWLYGSVFFKNEFGVDGGRDIMLPDCFGFPYSLPSLGAHCGKTGMHSAKLGWGSAMYDQLPPFGVWKGVDGSEIYAVYKPHAYDSHEAYNKDMSHDSEMESIIDDNYNKYEVAAEVRYVGPRSDHGGGLHDDSSSSGENTPYWLNRSVSSDGPVTVKMATPDEVFEHLAEHRNDKYHVYDGELPMRTHGVGAYTSQAVLKRWNRRNELLADAAEKASVATEWLGAGTYPREILREAWMNNLWQGHHDILTGTSIPRAYTYAQNEFTLANKTFGNAFTDAAGAFTASLDTRTEGTPVVLYNPLSFDRTDVAEAQISCASRPEGVRVFGPDGNEVLAQVAGYDEATGCATVIFAATVPSLGYAVYDVRPGEQCTLTSDLVLDANTLKINRGGFFRTSIDTKGDINIYDIQNQRPLMGNTSLVMLDDTSNSWPAWEITYETVASEPIATVNDNVEITVVEDGPLRKSVRVSRSKNGSNFVHYIRVNALNDRIDMVNEVEWASRNTLLKLKMPFRSAAREATYDISLGTIKRGINTSQHYEMQGHQWADMENTAGTAGVSVLNDCKYGWDMPDAGTLRLSLIHTPRATSYTHHQMQDLGDHRFTVSFFPHQGKWGYQTQQQAAMINQPLMAFTAPKHEGAMGRSFSFASLSTPAVAIKALKKAELSDEYIVRVYELTGEDHTGVKLQFPAAIISAREVNGLEEALPEAEAVSTEGNALTFNIGHYQPKTFAVRLARPETSVMSQAPSSSFVTLDYDTDIMSGHDALGDATSGITRAYPAELLSDEITSSGITFALGSREKGMNNALSCHGQKLSVSRNPGENKLYILAASTLSKGSTGEFTVGSQTVPVTVPYYGGFAGQAATPFNFGAEYRRDEVAFTATHSHNTTDKKDETYKFLYMYKYMIELPEEVDEITLPDAEGLYLLAATTSDNTHDDAKAVSEIYTYPGADKEGSHVDLDEGRLVPDQITANGSVNSKEAPAMASDGDINTKWCSTSAGSWLEYRFNKDVEVNRWALLNAGIENGDMITRSFKVQYLDGSSWRDISSLTANTSNYVSQSVTPVTARRFRLQVNAGEQNGGNTARIYEFALYGRVCDDSGVEEVLAASEASAIELTAITPNPCSGHAEISCRFPENTADPALEIYGMTGMRLRSIPFAADGAGEHRTGIDFSLGDGIYLCRLTALCSGTRQYSKAHRLIIH